MKRWWILLLTFGVVFALAVPAGAGKPQCDPTVQYPAPTPEHPACQADDPATEEPDLTWGIPCEDDAAVLEHPDDKLSSFIVELGGRKNVSELPDSACLNVMSDAGPWTVNVDVTRGTLKSMAVHIRDSDSPGDGCFPGGSCGIGLGPRDITEDSFTLDEYLSGVIIPEAYVNACNVFEDDNYFGEWYFNEELGESGEWEFYEGDWDENKAVWEALPSPLAFLPSVSGTNDLLVTLTVTFPTYTPPTPPLD
jgi:hypothetical protein